MSDVFTLQRGVKPIIISSPHSGTMLPADIAKNMTQAGVAIADTDWHVEKLYDFAPAMGISFLTANYSRYVVDLNRACDGTSLYPGENVTELCPTTSFDEQPLYKKGCAPTPEEVARRVANYWQPYHAALRDEIARIKAVHGGCILFEAHSIRSAVPRFFEGQLPDLNWGTDNGCSADPSIAALAMDSCQKHAPDLTQVMNGRFKGGYITRVNGAVDDGVHALQLEMSQKLYMDESPPYIWDRERAAPTKDTLKALFSALEMVSF